MRTRIFVVAMTVFETLAPTARADLLPPSDSDWKRPPPATDAEAESESPGGRGGCKRTAVRSSATSTAALLALAGLGWAARRRSLARRTLDQTPG